MTAHAVIGNDLTMRWCDAVTTSEWITIQKHHILHTYIIFLLYIFQHKLHSRLPS